MTTNNRKRLDQAEQAVAALERRRADRADENEVLTAETALLDEQIAATDARGEPTATLEGEREQKRQRQRDLAAVLPLLEQQLAEARAERFTLQGQLIGEQREAKREAVVRDGRALDGKVRALLEETAPLCATVQNDLNALAHLDERADYFEGRRHTRGPQSVYAVAREVPLLLDMLRVLTAWGAGRPSVMEVPAAPQAAHAPDPVAERLARTAGVR